ncbi:hypothetical protein G9A89_002091 [Geosiphon pyriformis]|nr:hypothetical protein G9A89_002091 [Geosiphon pyriformis]
MEFLPTSATRRENCRFFAQGTCYKDRNCNFMHPIPNQSHATRDSATSSKQGQKPQTSRSNATNMSVVAESSINTQSRSNQSSTNQEESFSVPIKIESTDQKFAKTASSTSVSSSSFNVHIKVEAPSEAPIKTEAHIKIENPGAFLSENKAPCKFFQRGYCRYDKKCWFLHETPVQKEANFSKEKAKEAENSENACSICFDIPTTYGLLESCDHTFCLECIRKWRKSEIDSDGGLEITKGCPMCRKISYYVVPSSRYACTGSGKESIINGYKEHVGQIPCKYFAKKKTCPFGDMCFFKHANPDGTRCALGPPSSSLGQKNREFEESLSYFIYGSYDWESTEFDGNEFILSDPDDEHEWLHTIHSTEWGGEIDVDHSDVDQEVDDEEIEQMGGYYLEEYQVEYQENNQQDWKKYDVQAHDYDESYYAGTAANENSAFGTGWDDIL